MPFIQNTDADRARMLAAIGVSSVEELFAPIPEGLRLDEELEIEGGWTETELRRHMTELASWNRPASTRPCFLGGGCYDHDWSAAVDHLAGRSEFLTAYTPYQPECAQGTLQWIFEFQSMIAELCGMEVANASMYDGASACAEAAIMALAIRRRSRVVVSAGLHPHARAALHTYLRHREVELVEAPLVDGRSSWEGLIDDRTAAVLVQQPNFLGLVEDLDPVVDACREHGALAVASVYPVALGLLRSPGAAGFDIVVGDGQSLGCPMGAGGPSFGFFATRMAFVRKMPGRIVGQTVDREGRRAFTLTFQTREQHIRRERATSNICTNNSLMALRGCIHMAALGPAGLEEAACLARQRALDLRAGLLEIEVFAEAFPGAPFFNELPFRVAGGAPAVGRFRSALGAAGVAGVLPMAPFLPGMEDVFTLACTERTRPEDIARLLGVARECFPMEVSL